MSVQFKITRRALLAGLPAVALAGGQNRGLQLSNTKGEKVAFAFGNTPLFEYRYGKSLPKPYVHPLYAPNQAVLTLDSPPDHKHHRALMIGWTEVNGYDFWGEPKSTPGPHGFTMHQKFERMREKSGELTAVNHWVAGGRILLVERRTLRAHPPGTDTLALDWESELKTGGSEVTLKAHKNGFDGLGIRFVHKMDGGKALNSEGTNTIEQANGQAARWCAYCGELESGGPGGAAIFDHPSNPRHPNPFYVMKSRFGFLSVAPTFRDPFRVAARQSLRLRYLVVAFLGEPDKAKLDSLYTAWASERRR